MALLYVSSMLPTPLYPMYQRQFGFSELLVTAIYASYVIGNLTVLLFFGRLSDQLGRKPAALIAFAVVMVCTLCFLAAQSPAWLFAGRILNGFAVGLGAATLTAWIAELEPRQDKQRASRLTSAGNLAGLAFGPLLAGCLAQYAAWPLRLCYLIYLVMAAFIMWLLLRTTEGVKRPVKSAHELSLRPRIGVPREVRFAFLSPAALAFATFALGGFYGALVPGLLTRWLHQTNLAIIGAVVALFFGTGAVVAALSGRLGRRAVLFTCLILLLLGLLALLFAEWQRSFSWVIVASFISGSAMALGFRSSLGMVNELAPEAQRAEVVSAYLLICYTANSLPVIGIGLLSRLLSASAVHTGFAILLAALAFVACWIGWRHTGSPRRINA